MDKILLNNMAFFGYHGVLEEETSLGQKFFLDIELYLDLKEAGINDDLNKGVSYADVYNIVKDIVENRTYRLLEALAENISIEIMKKFSLVTGLKVRVRKPEAPVPGIFDFFGVEIERFRGE